MRRIYLVIGLMLLALPHLSYGDSLSTLIPSGTDGQVLTSRGANDTPHWATPSSGMQVENGKLTVTSNPSNCPNGGTQTVTTTFQPTILSFMANNVLANSAAASWGWDIPTISAQNQRVSSASLFNGDILQSFYYDAGTWTCAGHVTSVTPTSFTLTYTSSGAPGQIYLFWTSFK